MIDQLIDDVALRIRHNAAMDEAPATPAEDERVELFLRVLWPTTRLLELSRLAALEDLERRHHR